MNFHTFFNVEHSDSILHVSISIFNSGVCFDAPSHILYLFVARVVNKIRNGNIVY